MNGTIELTNIEVSPNTDTVARDYSYLVDWFSTPPPPPTRRARLSQAVFDVLRRIPPRWKYAELGPHDPPEAEESLYHGVGHIAGVFWWAVIEEGWYGALDTLSFHYLDDWYVPHRWFTGTWR